jgi:hypothetical protein
MYMAGWWVQIIFIFHFIYGIDNPSHCLSHIFQDGEIATPSRLYPIIYPLYHYICPYLGNNHNPIVS